MININILKNYKAILTVSIVSGVIAALLGLKIFSDTVKLVPVLVTSKDIFADQLITTDNITVKKEPVGSLRADTLLESDIQYLKGMCAKGFIPANTPLRKTMVQPFKNSGISTKIGLEHKDKVVIALEPKLATTIGGALKKNDHVRIKCISKADSSMVLMPPETVVEKALVLEVPQKDSAIDGVLLAVTSDEAHKIEEKMQEGKSFVFELLPAEVVQ
ncbi:hypothetical protein JCM39194_25410 [Desulfotomaculum varum]